MTTALTRQMVEAGWANGTRWELTPAGRAAVGKARPVLLDLFCCAGGAAMGYHRAGFDVVGVDNRPQPRYPFRFVQGDALAFLDEHGAEFDAIHASPPCQRYSRATACFASANRVTVADAREKHVDLVDATRSKLAALGIPWIIENVEGAPLRAPVLLCGTMFGLRVYRHRLFESSELLLAPTHHRRDHRVPCVPIMARERREAGGYNAALERGWFLTVAGGSARVGDARAAMGIDWMTGAELNQAIPPAYTEFLGRQLIASVRARRVA
jgi:DNA (cytosine-5)-methyltransferase 1